MRAGQVVSDADARPVAAVERGAWVLRKLLHDPPTPAPANANVVELPIVNQAPPAALQPVYNAPALPPAAPAGMSRPCMVMCRRC